jgi:hypothetical protein
MGDRRPASSTFPIASGRRKSASPVPKGEGPGAPST